MKQWLPLLLAVIALLGVEGFLQQPGVQQRLDHIAVNPLPQKLAQLAAYQAPQKALDTLALGTSRTLNGFVPNSFGATQGVYNMGLPQASFDMALATLKTLEAHQQKPKRILLEVVDFMFDPHYVSHGLYYHQLMAQNPTLLGDIWQSPYFTQADKEGLTVEHLSALSRYKTVLAPAMLPQLLKSLLGKTKPAPLVTLQAGWEPLVHTQLQQATPPTAPIKLWVKPHYLPLDTQSFTLLLDYCQQHAIAVVLVEWPDQSGYATVAKGSPQRHAFLQAVWQAATSRHLPFISLDGLPVRTKDTLFADLRHLTPAGAKLYTGLLAQQLATVALP
jgi:hypothetical protein